MYGTLEGDVLAAMIQSVRAGDRLLAELADLSNDRRATLI
jgi:hypothetical protein